MQIFKSRKMFYPITKFRVIFVLLCGVGGGIGAGLVAPTIMAKTINSMRSMVHVEDRSDRPNVKPLKAMTPEQARKIETVQEEAKDPVPSAVEPHDDAAKSPTSIAPIILLGVLLGAFVGNKIADFFYFSRLVLARWQKMPSGDKFTTITGVLIGVIISMPILVILQSLQIQVKYVPWIFMTLLISLIGLSSYMLQSISEILPWSKTSPAARKSGIKVLDTNVIIDGRIRDIAKIGFLEGKLYVPQFVLEELQHIADHHDALRRQRGKRGLDILNSMQAEFQLEVGTLDHLAPDTGDPVDSRLVRLARAIGADLVTNDHNLNRVAALQEVRVLNLNDLALSLRPNVLPQEHLTLKVIREGQQVGQGVGYLDDGTMVVVENGAGHINETVDIEVTQVIQTERGKMIFGEINEESALYVDPGRARKVGSPKRF
jgi:uncharacterized protein YacL